MIVTERFAWAHLPKAGGDATHAMLTAVPGLVLSAAPIDSNEKHDAFWQHEDEIAGRLRAMNIRRLPSWALSAAHHKAVSGVHPDFEPLPMPSVEEMVTSTGPDDMLRWMTDGPRLAPDRWLRTERLADDLLELLGELGLRTAEAERAVHSVPWKGKPYDHRVEATFSAADVRRLYEHNPEWAAIEREVYGGLDELAER
jgi:hypothetical protein